MIRTGVGNDSNEKTHVSLPGYDSMTEPGLAGTTVVDSSVFGLERNKSRFAFTAGPLSDIWRVVR